MAALHLEAIEKAKEIQEGRLHRVREKRLARQQVKWMSLALMVKIYSKYIIEPEVFNYKNNEEGN